jgi:hypothetical protein
MTSTSSDQAEIVKLPNDTAKLDDPTKKKLMGIAGGIAGLGLVLSGIGAATDSHRFAFSWLVSFAWLLTIGLGGLFFIILQHLTKAGWSVTARRTAEWIAFVVPICIVLFIPIIAFHKTLYHHWRTPETEDLAKNVHGKAGYLNTTFFYIRAVGYFVIWGGLIAFFTRNSTKQDETGDAKLTLRSQFWSAPSTLFFGLSITFAAFDWLMSLQPAWYSTIWGVYIFAGSVTSSLSAIALVTIYLQGKGYLRRVSTVEHRHDIGKLLFGFVVFYAYIAFSQFILIWYANIPEETIFYHVRWDMGGWMPISMLIFLGHFVLPFLYLLPRTIKRHPLGLGAAAVWMLFMHYVDMYWIVMPTNTPKTLESAPFSPSWIDLGTWIFAIGVLALAVVYRAGKTALYPLKDPRLAESMKLDNL